MESEALTLASNERESKRCGRWSPTLIAFDCSQSTGPQFYDTTMFVPAGARIYGPSMFFLAGSLARILAMLESESE